MRTNRNKLVRNVGGYRGPAGGGMKECLRVVWLWLSPGPMASARLPAPNMLSETFSRLV